MKKIRFNQPKYILPLILLPFVFGLNWIAIDSFGANKDAPKTALEEQNEINPTLPDPILGDKENMQNKFEAVKEAYKYRQDYTAITDLDKDDIQTKDNSSLYTDEEKALIDSINTAILTGEEKRNFVEKVSNRTGPIYKRNSPAQEQSSGSKTKTNAHEEEMKLFREQMLILDSLSKSPEEREQQVALQRQEELQQQIEEQKRQEEEAIVPVSKSNNLRFNNFNTVKRDNEDLFIKAIIDEGIKVVKGSRVRIRLMDEINVGDYLVKKGEYLYGEIQDFKPQRIEISISSILVDDNILPVELNVYDNDGLLGLYVPHSSFREFTKDLGSGVSRNNNIDFSDDPNSATEFFYGIADNAVRTASKATGKASKRNRAKLKYNTIIYLVNPKELK